MAAAPQRTEWAAETTAPQRTEWAAETTAPGEEEPSAELPRKPRRARKQSAEPGEVPQYNYKPPKEPPRYLSSGYDRYGATAPDDRRRSAPRSLALPRLRQRAQTPPPRAQKRQSKL